MQDYSACYANLNYHIICKMVTFWFMVRDCTYYAVYILFVFTILLAVLIAPTLNLR